VTDVSSEAGDDPLWDPDGHTLYYRSGDQLLAVDVTIEPGFSPSAPRPLWFEEPKALMEGTEE
jgi:hypothetical protein